MSDNGKKDSFILYQEYADYIADLTGDEVKTLFTAIFLYREGKEIPEMSGMVKAYFKVIRNNLDRDERKYEATIQARIEAGRKGGRQKKANLANASFDKQSKANVAVSVPVPVPDNDPVPDAQREPVCAASHFDLPATDGVTLIEAARKLWNDSGAKPPERLLPIQFTPDDRSACLATVQAYTTAEIAASLKTYLELLSSPDHEVARPYRSFVGFMKGGVRAFSDDADPRNAYRKRAPPGKTDRTVTSWPPGGMT